MRTLKLILCLLLPLSLFSQNAVVQEVQNALEDGQRFEKTNLLQYETEDLSSRDISIESLEKGALMYLNYAALENLGAQRPQFVELEVPSSARSSIVLQLIRHDIFTPDFKLTSSSTNSPVDYKPGVHYKGIVKGDQHSIVAISVFEHEMMGMVGTSEGNFVLGKVEGSKGNLHIFYKEADLKKANDFACGTPDDGIGYSAEELRPVSGDRASGDCIRVYIEVDNDIHNNKGGVSGATNYITGLFNESIVLYANESVLMTISQILVWDTPSPYSSTSSSGMLSDFQANTGSFNGDLGHLVSYQASGGIAAGFAGICNSNPDNSKCFSSIDASYSNVPTFSWSVMVVTHEMGHLIGSRHTHACVWNGNNTAIDGCAGSTEGSCSLPGYPSQGGTIMSYCHLQSVGINFNEGFGPQPGNVIRNTMANSSCTSPCGSSSCTDGIQNGNETGVDCGGSSCPPCPCTGSDVTLTINLDNYPEETSWDIRDGGTVVASGGTYGSFPDGSQVVEIACLPDGCYDFTIYDSYGDGICCSYGTGDYTLRDENNTVLASGGQFGSSETTNFCVSSGGGPTCTDGIQNGDETGVDCGGSCPACPTCSDGIQNGDETGVDCGGSCPACPTCTDGIQNGDETGVDCGGSCPACPTCSDGIQNGNETGVDCGGPDCLPCSGGGSDVLLGSYFETGWDGWNDGGSDCYRYFGSRSWEGSYSIRIRDNSGTASAMTTSSSYDVSSYSSIDIEFYFYPNSMENGEDFWVRYFDGSSWSTVAAFARGTHFNNNTFYTATVTISSASYNFPTNAQFRFQCDASANSDRVYIDQVTITGNSSGSLVNEGQTIVATGGYMVKPQNFDMTNLEEEGFEEEVLVYPNPATNQLHISMDGEMESIRIFTIEGIPVRKVEAGSGHTDIDISDLSAGVYFIFIEKDGKQIPKKFTKF